MAKKMPEILTYNTPPKIAKERTKQPFYRSFFDWFAQKDKFTKIYIITFALIIPVTPFIVNNYLEIRQKAVGGAVRGVAGDFWADTILGRRDFTDVLAAGYVNPRWLQRPGGAVIDRDTPGSTLGYLFAQSTRENRIVALNLDNCIPSGTTCSAEKVIGQPSSADYSACNGDSSFQNYPNRVPASASTLCFVKEDAMSTAENLAFIGMYTQGGNLYVPDTENHRVLIYYNAWSDQVADEVIGQDDFSGNLCNRSTDWILNTTPSVSSLCLLDYSDNANSQSGVALDPTGNLWVADTGNHRTLRFSKDPTIGKFSKNADIVLGQPDFTTGPGHFGNGLNQMNNPNSLRFDPSGNLYISDGTANGGNARVLKFTPAEQRIGGMATVFATGTNFISEVDPVNNGIWAMSSPHLKLYGFDGVLKKDINIGNQFISGSVGVAKNGGVVVSSPSQGVLWINDPITKTSGWDRELFDRNSSINNSRLGAGHGVAIAGNKLFASDSCRILFWKYPASLTNGKAADGVLIQPNFNTFDCNVNHVASLKADTNNRVWAKTQKGILVYDATQTPPVKIGSIASVAGGGTPIPVLGGGSMDVLKDYEGLMGLAPQTVNSKLFLWVVDSNNSRVVRIRDPLTNPVIDVVLGQADIASTPCNRGQTYSKPTEPPLNYLCWPGHVSIDNYGNIYVSDHSLETRGNFRLLVFHTSDFPSDNTSVIFDSTAFKSFPQYGQPNPDIGQKHATWEVAFDSQNHMVVGYNAYVGGRFLGYYLNPLDPAKNQPDGYFKDYYSMAFGATFDAQDNLYVADINRPRVMIYKNPFNNIVPSPSPSLPSPSPAASSTPTPIPTSSPTIIPTSTPVPITQPVSSTGSITGTVSSSAGGVVSGVKITVSVKRSLTYTTNSLGVYTITSLNPGTYSLKFSAQGYLNKTVSVTVSSNTTTTANVTLVRR